MKIKAIFQKKFLEWIKLKKKTHYNKNKISFQERDVWMCHFDENVGFESNGKNEFFHRPVVVVRKFNNRLFYGLPMSTKLKNNKFYTEIDFKNKKQSVMISQMRALDVNRLHYKMGKMKEPDFKLVKKSFLKIFVKK